MKLSRLIKKATIPFLFLGLESNVSNAETTLIFNPIHPLKSNVQTEYQRGNNSVSFRLNDQSLASYLLRDEGQKVFEGNVELNGTNGFFEQRDNSKKAGIKTKLNKKLGSAYLELQPNLTWSKFDGDSSVNSGIELRVNSYHYGFFLKNYLKQSTGNDEHWYESKIGKSTKKGTLFIGLRDHDAPSIERLKHVFAYGDCYFLPFDLYGTVDETLSNGYLYTELGAQYKPSDKFYARITNILQKARGYSQEHMIKLKARISPLIIGVTKTETNRLLPYVSVEKEIGDINMKASYGIDEIRDDLGRNQFSISMSFN